MIEPKIVIFLIHWLLPATTILARQWLNGRHVVLPTKGTSKKQQQQQTNKTKQKYVASISRHLGPPYGHAILVSGYPVVKAVNWPQHGSAVLGSRPATGAH